MSAISPPKAAGRPAEPDQSFQDVAYDEDDMPIPDGIAEVNDKQLEESGESLNLDMSKANNQVWLVKLPPALSEVWKNERMLDGRQLGNIKIQQGVSPAKIMLELNEKLQEHKNIDKEYELKMIKHVVENEYVFSEAELSQFKSQAETRTEMVQMPDQPTLNPLDGEEPEESNPWSTAKVPQRASYIPEARGRGYEEENFEEPKKVVPFAKTIPKKTALVGKIVHECQVIPTKLSTNNKLKLLEQKRRLAQMTKRKTITYMKDANAGVLQGRTGPNLQTGSTIQLSRELAARKEQQRLEGRASRMDREHLMKVLFNLFNEYDYWTLKGIREKTNQPEAYLKDCLENIAVMERKGTYALKYRLKDEYKKSREVERKEKQGFGDLEADNRNENDDDGDEDDDIEMEDVA
ncbi:hypothetical protein KL918_001036 [Ogataea parapolymorpha]|uniref:Transcription initiation factor IIF subunit beta n=1 Tax=Ogataea parapolymorpha (strain ATCC 26012 / BCRC 20466 / JCM 22074 / NRRL Y-7560 / DL-1) TaxID=871575 RepID=W1QAQ1_OGAPD|nr:transcription initiation factor TFIIF beta subunit [Ogataea parapolymorpha DL-1]ESW97423.1 transcription initiation factor TFIIF beta subunit [Ogataea parapolymorpha DL-1]KAG7869491.1 hypothetical protein KL918_001036 [Ogataea parapolymorpha]KAG7875456.1 hypothetical protein KL916_000127 [Ogataea parapolymorpha]